MCFSENFSRFVKSILTPFEKFTSDFYALVIGHFTVFIHSFRKRITLEYPEKKVNLNNRFRGKIVLNIDKCLGCSVCQLVCPSFGTIKIKKDKDENGKMFVKEYTIDYSKCIFCGNCVQNCSKNALCFSKEYELAKYNLEDLKSTYVKKNHKLDATTNMEET